ncbi:MAG: methionine--tRNA ligase [Lewinellaceae bacterium]|nr:methionine--tRNA ligase [Phaeodactylibacter sp.]MCB0613711.1 methionine--tRNA ligase [Phaeodactylibacter sp.]MCB9351557.1 methionine--tRNA ligase [Lewinellaceae bacterium]
MSKRYLITSALPYANGALHLGHLAGAYLPADIYVRYLRLLGKDVVWVCGSDEHGAAITIRAKKEGISPQEIIDKYHTLNKDTFSRLGISFDYYHRTSAPLHHETSQDFFLKLYEKGGEFEEREIEQYYDEEYDQFLADRYIVGACPKCGHEEAFGDQCENCGSDLSPLELIHPRSTLSGKAPQLKTTKHWYFKLDKHENWLREWIDTGVLEGELHHDPKTWKRHVVGQCLSWLDTGLQPRAITRDLDWGIPVPLEEAKGKVLYVWFDAPIGYISSTRQWAKENGKDWELYWKDNDTTLIHFIGKDNIVFHCIVFPAMLKAYGEYNLPVNVPANQFLNFEGQKFSKSRGWGIEQHEYLEEFKNFPNKEDALRYALIRNMPENKDADFKWDEFTDFHDKELADNLGNFVNRVIVLTNKYFEGVVPPTSQDIKTALAPAREIVQKITGELDAFSFRSAVITLMELSSWGNTYLQDVSPWKIYKADPDSQEIKDCMFTSLQVVALLSVLADPFIPFTAPKIRRLLNLPALQNGDLQEALNKLETGEPIISAGHKIGEPELLFAKIVDRKDDSLLQIINRQKEKLQMVLETEEGEKREPIKPTIQYEDFAKLDLRTGAIIAAEAVPKADKLLKLTIDLGSEQRTVVSGIAQFFKPEELPGLPVVVVANLAPRKLRGIESQGMILMAENDKGELAFVNPKKGWGNGWVVR